ncbi:MsnO8 family LLM class oxidoreductase [Salana multivorans]
MKLSVLDLIPVRTGQTSALALQASRSLLALADELGFERYWVAEHHNMPAVASSVPGVLLPYLAGQTHRIRLGSGGVMLPNHTALDVAEQFALLEAMYPGRVDLGIGRAPGSDPVTSYLLRLGRTEAPEESFEQDVLLLREMLGMGETPVGEPVTLSLGGRPFEVRATPSASSATALWLLGSSGFSVKSRRSARAAVRVCAPLRHARDRGGAGAVPRGIRAVGCVPDADVAAADQRGRCGDTG